MAISQTIPFPDAGEDMRFAIARKSDGLLLDFADGTFKAKPGTPLAVATEGAPPLTRAYTGSVAITPVAQYPDGLYSMLFVCNGGKGGCCGIVDFQMGAGSDQNLMTFSGTATVVMNGSLTPNLPTTGKP